MSRLALLHPAVVGMGLRVAIGRARRAIRGHRRFEGSAEDILPAMLWGAILLELLEEDALR
jgi:hypothetical protein